MIIIVRREKGGCKMEEHKFKCCKCGNIFHEKEEFFKMLNDGKRAVECPFCLAINEV